MTKIDKMKKVDDTVGTIMVVVSFIILCFMFWHIGIKFYNEWTRTDDCYVLQESYLVEDISSIACGAYSCRSATFKTNLGTLTLRAYVDLENVMVGDILRHYTAKDTEYYRYFSKNIPVDWRIARRI